MILSNILQDREVFREKFQWTIHHRPIPSPFNVVVKNNCTVISI